MGITMRLIAQSLIKALEILRKGLTRSFINSSQRNFYDSKLLLLKFHKTYSTQTFHLNSRVFVDPLPVSRNSSEQGWLYSDILVDLADVN